MPARGPSIDASPRRRAENYSRGDAIAAKYSRDDAIAAKASPGRRLATGDVSARFAVVVVAGPVAPSAAHADEDRAHDRRRGDQARI